MDGKSCDAALRRRSPPWANGPLRAWRRVWGHCFTVGTTRVETIRSPSLTKTPTIGVIRPKCISAGLVSIARVSSSLLLLPFVASLEQLDHEGLIDAVSSGQLMLMC